MTHFLALDAILSVAQQVNDAGGPPVPPISGPRDSFVQNVRHHVSFAYTAWACLPDWSSDSRSRRRFEALGEVQQLSRALKALVDNGDIPLDASLARHLKFPDSVEDILSGVARLGVAATAERYRLRDAGFDASAPLSHLEGPSSTRGSEFIRWMTAAYEVSFGKKAAVTFDDTREPGGPFVAFVLGCMRAVHAAEMKDGIAEPEFPITATPGAVAQAFARWKRIAPSDKDQ